MINYVLNIAGKVHQICVDVTDIESNGLGEYLVAIGLLTESYPYAKGYTIISRS
ncbi:hypothetical protein OKW21_006065 [Catalinimonas alkaloidigena]|nr:hypothetical protein [Catalinimonas alkaloidigena]